MARLFVYSKVRQIAISTRMVSDSYNRSIESPAKSFSCSSGISCYSSQEKQRERGSRPIARGSRFPRWQLAHTNMFCECRSRRPWDFNNHSINSSRDFVVPPLENSTTRLRLPHVPSHRVFVLPRRPILAERPCK